MDGWLAWQTAMFMEHVSSYLSTSKAIYLNYLPIKQCCVFTLWKTSKLFLLTFCCFNLTYFRANVWHEGWESFCQTTVIRFAKFVSILQQSLEKNRQTIKMEKGVYLIVNHAKTKLYIWTVVFCVNTVLHNLSRPVCYTLLSHQNAIK